MAVSVACDDDHNEGGENETVISEHGEDESHKMGENCMRCHYSEGEAEGWFTTAGTVYSEGAGGSGGGDDDDDDKDGASFADMEVWISTLPDAQGDILQKIEVDDLGNFYTTEAIDYSRPRYVVVKIGNEIEEMHQPIYHGQCNLCHGVTDEILEF